MNELREKLEKIVNGHRRGLKDRMQTVQTLKSFYNHTEEPCRRDFHEYLASLLQTEPIGTRAEAGMGINIPAVAIIMIADSCPTEDLPDLIFSRIRLDDAQTMLDWASELCPVYEFCLFHNSQRFEGHALERTKELSKRIRTSDNSLVLSLVEALGRLERTIERIEFDHFEKSLTRIQGQPEIPSRADDLTTLLRDIGLDVQIAEALKTADDYLRGAGEFKETIAAGLLRSSIDVTHRAIVCRLEILKKMPYTGQDMDKDRRAYLCESGFITAPEKQFFAAIYTLISQEASHKLIAPKETVLVLQTTVNNYLLLLLRRLRDLSSGQP